MCIASPILVTGTVKWSQNVYCVSDYCQRLWHMYSSIPSLKCHGNANLKGKTQKCHDNANLKGKTLKYHDNANLKGKTQI